MTDTKTECLHQTGHRFNGVGMWICLACGADITPEESQPISPPAKSET